MAARIFVVISCLHLALLPTRAEPIPYYEPSSYQPSSYQPSYSQPSYYHTTLPTSSIPTKTYASSSSTSKPTAYPASESWSGAYSGYTSVGSTLPPAATDHAPGVKFHPDGSSPGFFCEYPSLSEWQACNGPVSRDCWLRKTAPKAKERGDGDGDNQDDDSQWGDQIDIHTDCECSWAPSSTLAPPYINTIC